MSTDPIRPRQTSNGPLRSPTHYTTPQDHEETQTEPPHTKLHVCTTCVTLGRSGSRWNLVMWTTGGSSPVGEQFRLRRFTGNWDTLHVGLRTPTFKQRLWSRMDQFRCKQLGMSSSTFWMTRSTIKRMLTDLLLLLFCVSLMANPPLQQQMLPRSSWPTRCWSDSRCLYDLVHCWWKGIQSWNMPHSMRATWRFGTKRNRNSCRTRVKLVHPWPGISSRTKTHTNFHTKKWHTLRVLSSVLVQTQCVFVSWVRQELRLTLGNRLLSRSWSLLWLLLATLRLRTSCKMNWTTSLDVTGVCTSHAPGMSVR